MKTKTAITDQIAEALDFSALLTLLLPIAFPIMAIADGAQDAYQTLAIFYTVGAAIVSCVAMLLCTALSSFFAGIESARIERERDAKLFHNYLLNGGRI